MWRLTSFIVGTMAFLLSCVALGCGLWLAFNLLRGVQ